MYLPNNKPKVIIYRDYKNFDISPFFEELLFEIKKLGPLNKNMSIVLHVCIVLKFMKNMLLKNKGILE